MRTPVNNPFRPGSDSLPAVWAGRDQELRDWTTVVRPRRVAGIYERGRTFLGEAGMGKSTLVRRIARLAAEHGDWVTPQVRIPVEVDSLKLVASALLSLADQAGLTQSREKKIKDYLNRVRSVSVKGISLTLERHEGPEPFMSLRDLLIEIGKEAAKRDKVVIVHIDEMQNINDPSSLSQLLIALGDALVEEIEVRAPGGYQVSRVLPIAVYLTGLPEFVEMTSAPKGATFARRFATTTLGPIPADDLKLALQPFVTEGWPVPNEKGGLSKVFMTPEAASLLVDLCRGEPFLFQLAGDRAWNAGSGEVITADDVKMGWAAAKIEAISHVERILDRLPAREREFLDAMAQLPPELRTATNIAKQMGLADATKGAPFAQRLDVSRGIINRGTQYTFRHRAIESYLTTGWPN